MTLSFCSFPVFLLRYVPASNASKTAVFLLHVIRHGLTHEHVDCHDGQHLSECK